ncbi:hypothetical protein ACWKW4_20845 [Hydrogenophaga borbori]
MTTRVAIIVVTLASSTLLMGCPKETTSTTFLDMAKACIPENLLGPAGVLVFYGPNDYRPGDLFTRSGLPNGKWSYDPRIQYATLVDAATVSSVVKEGAVPAACEFGRNNSFSFSADVAGNSTVTVAAVPLAASAAVSLKGGKVATVRASKIYVDTLPFFEPYSESLIALPTAAPAKLAIQNGGYYVVTAVLVTEGYAVDVQYGPEVAANLGAQATLPASDKGNLKAEVGVSVKNSQTLTYTVQGKTALALVVRPISDTMRVQTALAPGVTTEGPQYPGLIESRGWKPD